MDIEKLLNMLGNETRREILQMLSERPYYVSEISQELSIGQKAIIEHLSLMRGAGMIESRFEKVKKGRPRKYFLISKDVMLEVSIGTDTFNARTSLITIDTDVLNSLPKLKKITCRLEEISEFDVGESKEELSKIYRELEEEKENIMQAKKVIECIQGKIRSELKKDAIEKELERLLV
ncbi:ArsR family transcriptional regulator [archaeon]|nr:ArsR family transcriptional regulator [archaeon]